MGGNDGEAELSAGTFSAAKGSGAILLGLRSQPFIQSVYSQEVVVCEGDHSHSSGDQVSWPLHLVSPRRKLRSFILRF